MNLAVLKKTRRAPEVGDIFVMQPPDGQFLFGRVVDTNADPLAGPSHREAWFCAFSDRDALRIPT
jgi:hypothetical protein